MSEAQKVGKSKVVAANAQSMQIIDEDRIASGGVITPFFDHAKCLKLYYANIYHRLCINIKTKILSMIEETDLDKFLVGVTPKQFLSKSILDLEMYGNMYTERAGNAKYPALYHLPAKEARIGKERAIYQTSGFKQTLINAVHLGYDSPSSRFYGEPDYLASINAILTNENIDLYNQAFFENGAMPRLAIIFENSEPSEEQIEHITNFLRTSYRGVGNAHKTLLLSVPSNVDGTVPTIKIEKLSATEDLSFERLRGINRDDVVASHGVPPRMVGIVNAGGWGGSGELMGQLHTFNEICIKPKQQLLEEYFASLGIKLILKPLDVTNFKDDSEVVPNLVSSGILTPIEAKNILGWSKNV
ncbi:phage portal protein [Sulfurospirillum cavolei]|uniref:phage portal protein n=1 Tax=Sulfurospirillum cavolei TaxID=366522 RepID=UPI0005A5F4CF|nr:phage portal protein [Sulfurospirillum cavolei]